MTGKVNMNRQYTYVRILMQVNRIIKILILRGIDLLLQKVGKRFWHKRTLKILA